MADAFLYSGDGSDGDDGSTWALAKATLATGIAAIDSAGQRICIDSRHSESASTISYTSPGTAVSPMQLLSVTQTGTNGISALTAGALFSTTSTTHAHAGSFYAYGITYRSTSASSHDMTFGQSNGSVITFDTCKFELTGSGGGSTISFGAVNAGGGSYVELRNPQFKMGATGQLVVTSADVKIKGGSFQSGGTNPTAVFGASPSNRGTRLTVEGFDFSLLTAGTNIHGGGQGGAVAIFRDCLMPQAGTAAWTGAPITDGNMQEGQRIELWNYKNNATWKRVWIKDKRMSLVDEDTIVLSGGASDTAAYSWKMTTTANCAYPSSVAISPDMAVVNTTTGSSLTVTVEIVHDSVTNLTDAEVWLEVEEPDGTITTDAVADVITTAADQASSSVTWTTTGLTNPNKQKLVVTINASRAGVLLCRVCCAKASKVIYIDPAPVVA